jgi:hypothetical protein
MDINKRALDLANHLLDIETKSKTRKNKRSPSEVDKFIKSTQWLSKRILSNYSASKNAQTRLARDKNRYKANSHNIVGLGYDILIKGVVFWLEVEGFIYNDKNAIYRKEEGKGEQTRIKPYSKFIEWFNVDLQTLPKQIVAFEDTNPIIYQQVIKKKNSKGKPTKIKKIIPYEDTPKTIEMRKNINVINDCLKRHWSDLELTDIKWEELQTSLLTDKEHDYSPILLHKQTIKRIFNDKDFTQGGRFYGGWWQNIPSPYRALITIDGSRTNEFDFGRLHPTMMYADAKATCEGDAYDIGIDTKHRDTIKELFNAMVQMQEFTDHPPRVKFSQTGRTWKQLRDMILKRHEPIKHMFFCGIGNSLQYRDSIIAEQVMLHFAKNDIPILPVHDSFIITAGLFIDLIEVMEKEFKKQIGVPINIRSAEKSVRVRAVDNENLVGYVLNEMKELSDWTARNPL